MDKDINEKNRSLYNKHANDATKDTQQILKERDQGLSAPLKVYHNTVKRLLIQRFASDADRLLDLACGRGGDLRKWVDVGIKYVKGYDQAECECDEAKRRLEGLRESDRTGKLANFSADFEPTGDLGLKVWAEAEPFDAVSCMFALHYFFASESAATKMVEMIALNLREGGYFFGTLPDGKRVVETLGPEMRFEMAGLKLVPKWKGTTKPFGSAYTCAIADTVTEGHEEGDDGSYEYLVYQNVLVPLAKKFDLHPVTDFNDDELDQVLDPAQASSDGSKLFRRFHPRFPASPPGISSASALNCAFVFVKGARHADGAGGAGAHESADADTDAPRQSLKRVHEEDSLAAEDQQAQQQAALLARTAASQSKYKRSSKLKVARS